MFTTQRSPICEEDRGIALEPPDPICVLASALADLEAKAWLHDLRMVAILIGAARIELRETAETWDDGRFRSHAGTYAGSADGLPG